MEFFWRLLRLEFWGIGFCEGRLSPTSKLTYHSDSQRKKPERWCRTEAFRVVFRPLQLRAPGLNFGRAEAPSPTVNTGLLIFAVRGLLGLLALNFGLGL